MTVWDKLLMVLVLAAVLGSTWVVRGAVGAAGGGTEVTVKVAGILRHKLPLSTDKKIRIKTAAGSCILEVREGKARVVESDCPNHLCETQGPVDENGGIIVCLPHKIVVSVEAPAGAFEVDAVVR